MSKAKRAASKIFGALAVIYAILAGGIIIIATIIGSFAGQPDFIHGWNKLLNTLEPQNVAHYILVAIICSPALLFWTIKQKLELKPTKNIKHPQMSNLKDYEGVYMYEGSEVVILVNDNRLFAKTSSGVSVHPMDVVVNGRKIRP